jgi:Kdo2-lipid IVA lauroyltransferase/acyltransferase
MARPRSLTIDYSIYLAIRLFVCVIQGLPLRAGYSIAHALAWLAYRIDRRHRQVALDNLRVAFPGRYSPHELDQLVCAVYQHFCRMVIEIIHLPRCMHWNNWRNHLELRDGRRMVGSLLSGRPLLIVTGHFGNWELAGYALGLLGFTTHAVARPLDNPFLDRYLQRFRECTGQKLLAKHGDFEQMQAILNGGGVIATLGDQDAGQRGLYVDFFNRPASTHKAMALLALEHRVPVAVTGTPRIGEGLQYHVELEDLILPEEYEGLPDAIRVMTQRLTTALERIVRRYPEQYFWLHRRWKHQPKERAKKNVA